VLVASKDIGIGSTVAGEDLRWQVWPTDAAGAQFIRRGDRPDAINQLVGSLVRQPFAAGEPIREIKLIKAQGSGYMAAILPQGKRAIATEITPETGAGGFILPNDHVDVILSRRGGDSKTDDNVEASEVVLTNVRVLAIDQAVEEKDGKRVVVGKTATLEVSPNQAQALLRAKANGTLTLALRSVVDFETSSRSVEEESEDRRAINTIRFGVSTTTKVK
jgi:pilus assembly protein CpaB